jgi:3-oxoacyl-[acyl-carrier protein] reductase
MRLKDKTAIITGSSQGIGEAVALAFAAEGARVCVNYYSYAQGAESVVARIRAQGGQAIAVQADVSQADEVARMVQTTRNAFGPIDILVNNAAIYPRCAWQDMTEEAWDRIMDTDLKGQFLCAKAVSDEMCARRTGKIINVSSVTYLVGMKNLVHYISAKGGVVGLTRALARELGEYNVCVNCVIPGAILVPRELEVAPDQEATYAMLMERQAIQRRGVAQDMVGAFLLFASSEGDFITGQCLNVDGGWALY